MTIAQHRPASSFTPAPAGVQVVPPASSWDPAAKRLLVVNSAKIRTLDFSPDEQPRQGLLQSNSVRDSVMGALCGLALLGALFVAGPGDEPVGAAGSASTAGVGSAGSATVVSAQR